MLAYLLTIPEAGLSKVTNADETQGRNIRGYIGFRDLGFRDLGFKLRV